MSTTTGAARAVVFVQWLGIAAFVALWALHVPDYLSVWDNPYQRTAVIGECVLKAAMLAFALYVAGTMMRRRRAFPVMFAVELVLTGLLPVITFLWICHATGIGMVAILIEPGVLGWAVLGGGAAALWMVLVHRSPALAGAFAR